MNDVFDDDILENGYYLLSPAKRKPHSITINRRLLKENESNCIKFIVSDYLQNTIGLPECDSKILQFQGNEAYLFSNIYVCGNISEQSYFCIAFVKDKYLYLIQIVIVGYCSEIPAGVFRFVNTFQSDSQVQSQAKPAN
jgi:hypothetical protein